MFIIVQVLGTDPPLCALEFNGSDVVACMEFNTTVLQYI